MSFPLKWKRIFNLTDIYQVWNIRRRILEIFEFPKNFILFTPSTKFLRTKHTFEKTKWNIDILITRSQIFKIFKNKGIFAKISFWISFCDPRNILLLWRLILNIGPCSSLEFVHLFVRSHYKQVFLDDLSEDLLDFLHLASFHFSAWSKVVKLNF